jgi:hypothetical protein
MTSLKKCTKRLSNFPFSEDGISVAQSQDSHETIPDHGMAQMLPLPLHVLVLEQNLNPLLGGGTVHRAL